MEGTKSRDVSPSGLSDPEHSKFYCILKNICWLQSLKNIVQELHFTSPYTESVSHRDWFWLSKLFCHSCQGIWCRREAICLGLCWCWWTWRGRLTFPPTSPLWSSREQERNGGQTWTCLIWHGRNTAEWVTLVSGSGYLALRCTHIPLNWGSLFL